MGIGLTVVIIIEAALFAGLGIAFWVHTGRLTEEAQRKECRKQLRPVRIINDFYGERG